ncbi:MAG TPA: replicative DNA helicase [Candidatus Azoamicus sp.]
MDFNSNLQPIEAEQAILSSVIAHNELWNDISQLEEEDFSKTEHQMIFKMMKYLISHNDPIDKITLINLLDKANKNKSTYDLTHSLIDNAPILTNIKTYIRIVQSKSILRKLIQANTEIINFTLQYKDTDLTNIFNLIEEKLSNLSKKIDSKSEIKNISNVLTNTIKNIEQRIESKSNITGLSSGFKDLDEITSGFQKSDLIVIAGRPSMGKSTLAINIAENVSIENNKSIILFSMEMSADQVATRMISSFGRIQLHKLRCGNIDNSDWPKLSASIDCLSKKHIFIDDSGALTPFDIKNRIKKIKNLGNDIGLVIIDYIQLIKIPGLQDNRSREIAEISRSLKILAKDFDIPIIVLSQLNRSVEQRNDKRPLMSDLRESGAIEQDSDLIIFIYRDNVYNKTDNENTKSEIIISKQRNGPTGKIYLNFSPEICKFENIKQHEKTLL